MNLTNPCYWKAEDFEDNFIVSGKALVMHFNEYYISPFSYSYTCISRCAGRKVKKDTIFWKCENCNEWNHYKQIKCENCKATLSLCQK